MPSLSRVPQKIFGEEADTQEFGQIGSKAAGNVIKTKDIAILQQLQQYMNGLFAITRDEGTSKLPYVEDLNSLFYLITYQLKYGMQAGVPEWDSETEYYSNKSIVQHIGQLYTSIEGTNLKPNIGNIPEDTAGTYWEKIGGDTGGGGEATFPIGFTYIQLPGGGSPDELSMPGTWSNISNDFKDRFLRIDGDSTVDFDAGGLQSAQHNSLSLIEVVSADTCNQQSSRVYLPEVGASDCLSAPILNPQIGDEAFDHRLRFSKDGGEERPANVAIRIWRKIA